ncbi:MAG: S1 RNA-binding domain-containing protein [Candidatus Nealsonbacteria bacterium]
MKNILELKSNILRFPKFGEIVEGTVTGLGRSTIYVDLGSLGTGIIYGKEFQNAKDILKKLKTGDKLFSKITDIENEEGYVELSLSEAGKEMNWEKLNQKKESNETVTVKVLGANKGGLLVEFEGTQGFLPVSQLSPEHYPRVEGADKIKILNELQKFIGQEMEVKIFDVNQREEKLIFSEKAKETQKIKETLKNYKVGDMVKGEITGIVDFGAFIKFSKKGEAEDLSLEGLIHISELDWQLIENPSEIIKVGEKVQAKIIEINEDGRVFLSLKALKKDPWEDIEKKYKKGEELKGKVTKFNPFGAFIEIAPKIQGLVHISEFGAKSKMEEKMKIGEKYKFQILQIDPEEHRMTLKLIKD